jgi:hypothetical protein
MNHSVPEDPTFFGLSRLDRAQLVLISLVNYALQTGLSPDWRVKYLEHLDKMTGDPVGDNGMRALITHKIINSIDPICDRGWELALEAQRAGPFGSLEIYADAFATFVALNPSLIAWRKAPTQ